MVTLTNDNLANVRRLLVRRDAQAKLAIKLLGHLELYKMVYILLGLVDVDRVDEVLKHWEEPK